MEKVFQLTHERLMPLTGNLGFNSSFGSQSKTSNMSIKITQFPKPHQMIHCGGVAKHTHIFIQDKLLYLTHTSRKTKLKTDFKSSVLIITMLQNWPQFGPHHSTRRGKTPEGFELREDEDRQRKRASGCSTNIPRKSLERISSELQTTLISPPHLTAWVTTTKEENKFIRHLLS